MAPEPASAGLVGGHDPGLGGEHGAVGGGVSWKLRAALAHPGSENAANPAGSFVAGEGRIDIVFNAMGPQASEYGNATSTMDLPVEKFMLPISTIVASQFITARAAARHMAGRGSGVVVLLSGTPSRGTANTSAIGAAFGALESLTRSLAVDLGPHGVRVVCVRTMGMAETRVIQQTYDLGAKTMGAPKEKVEEIVTT